MLQSLRITLPDRMPDEWLTTGQAAALLGISRSTVVRYIEAGTLEARRLPGGHWRIRRAVAEKLLRDDFDAPDDDASSVRR